MRFIQYLRKQYIAKYGRNGQDTSNRRGLPRRSIHSRTNIHVRSHSRSRNHSGSRYRTLFIKLMPRLMPRPKHNKTHNK